MNTVRKGTDRNNHCKKPTNAEKKIGSDKYEIKAKIIKMKAANEVKANTRHMKKQRQQQYYEGNKNKGKIKRQAKRGDVAKY